MALSWTHKEYCNNLCQPNLVVGLTGLRENPKHAVFSTLNLSLINCCRVTVLGAIMPARRSSLAGKRQSSVGVKAVLLKPARSSATTESRFVACPVCDLHVPSYCINEHLDSACTTAVAASPEFRGSILSKGLKMIAMPQYNSSSCRTVTGLALTLDCLQQDLLKRPRAAQALSGGGMLPA